MDRGNLEALAEEEDEESWAGSTTSGSDDEDEDVGTRRSEPNKFDSLCDGVLGSVALVHATLTELLDLKDELLKHSLPPNVLVKLALVTSKVFRGVSDMNQPINELVRLVRVYSTPWEEKSTALKKLHEDYEAKKTQLNIAIKRLQLVDAHSRRIAKEKRIMNWEKLFAKLTSAKGHGRRWKFLIESFKEKAKLGMDHLQRYLDEMQENSSDEEEDLPGDIQTQMDKAELQVEQPEEQSEEASSEKQGSDQEEDEESESGGSKDVKDSEFEWDEDSGRHVRFESEQPMFIRPPMKDKECWTHAPEYERDLHVRVYKPEGLEYRELKCVVSKGRDMKKTGILDPAPTLSDEEEETKVEEIKPEEVPKQVLQENKLARRPARGLIGTRGRGGGPAGRPGAARAVSTREPEPSKKEKKKKRNYEELVFRLPEEVSKTAFTKNVVIQELENLRVAVHFGPKEEMIAMATIDMDDLETLDLPTVFKPEPKGDDFNPKKKRRGSPGSVSSSDHEGSTHSKTSEKSVEYEDLKGLEPISFPLYSIHAGKSDAMHMPCGAIPLLCFWGKTLKPRTFNRSTASASVKDIVMDLTGFNLDVVSKDDLHKEMKDEALSTISFTPEPTEEQIPRTEYDKIMQAHAEEIELLQTEYEQRLQDLADSLQEMQNSQVVLRPASSLSGSRSGSAKSSRSHSPSLKKPAESASISVDVVSSKESEKQLPQPPGDKPPKKNFRVGKPLPHWGQNLPRNFFERLRWFEEASAKHKQEMMQKTSREVSNVIERNLASQYRIRHPDNDDPYDVLQDVSLPAVFMPFRGANVYNPRAHHYFHPTGSQHMRLTQPPSMVHLPPLPKEKVPVMNLFDLSQNFHRGGPEWLMQRFFQQQTGSMDAFGRSPTTPAPTYFGQQQSTNSFLETPGTRQQELQMQEEIPPSAREQTRSEPIMETA